MSARIVGQHDGTLGELVRDEFNVAQAVFLVRVIENEVERTFQSRQEIPRGPGQHIHVLSQTGLFEAGPGSLTLTRLAVNRGQSAAIFRESGSDPESAVSIAGADLQPSFRSTRQDEGMDEFTRHAWDRQGVIHGGHERFQFGDGTSNPVVHLASSPDGHDHRDFGKRNRDKPRPARLPVRRRCFKGYSIDRVVKAASFPLRMLICPAVLATTLSIASRM